MIEALHHISDERLKVVSAQSATLKSFIKLPMLLVVATSALQSGLTVVFLKLVTELIASGETKENIVLIVSLGLAMGFSGTI